MSGYGTKFVETEAILAAMDRDAREMWRLIEGMTWKERTALEEACEYLMAAMREATASDRSRGGTRP